LPVDETEIRWVIGVVVIAAAAGRAGRSSPEVMAVAVSNASAARF
jgi:hypothetical protein